MAGSPHLEHSLTYRAHKMLSPCTGKGEDQVVINRNLKPTQYRYHRSHSLTMSCHSLPPPVCC